MISTPCSGIIVSAPHIPAGRRMLFFRFLAFVRIGYHRFSVRNIRKRSSNTFPTWIWRSHGAMRLATRAPGELLADVDGSSGATVGAQGCLEAERARKTPPRARETDPKRRNHVPSALPVFGRLTSHYPLRLSMLVVLVNAWRLPQRIRDSI